MRTRALVLGLTTIAALLACPRFGSGREFERRSISFSGLTWLVKGSTGRVGPGPNYFSDHPANVWVDAQGRLHLVILKSPRYKRRWYCAEVLATTSLGYGTYRFDLDSAVDALDPNVVLGLFTWSDDPAYAHRELDVEFSRWRDPANQNAQYVVQPYGKPGHLFRFDEPHDTPNTTHGFVWSQSAAAFESTAGGVPIQDHTFTDAIPAAGGEVVHLNLWLNQPRGPTDGQPVEVVIRGFAFVPP